MANKSSFSWALYQQAPIVGIVRGMPIDTLRWIAQAYLEAGLYTLEVTMNTEGAAEIIALLRHDFPGLNIGAGTVCDMDDLHRALDAGAQFIVAPILNEAVIQYCVEQETPIFPGAFTPTEIYRAWTLGASAVKVFPANQFGLQYIKDVAAPLDKIKLLPTGGISRENIRAFFEAGVFGVGMGSSLFPKDLIKAGDLELFQSHLVSIKAEIEDYSSSA